MCLMNKKLVLAGIAVFAVLLGTTALVPAIGDHVAPGDPNHPGKFLICHKPVGGTPKTLSVDAAGVHDHLNDHDGPPGAGPDTPGMC